MDQKESEYLIEKVDDKKLGEGSFSEVYKIIRIKD